MHQGSPALPPPWQACNLWRGFNPPPSMESKTIVFTVSFALQCHENHIKRTILRLIIGGRKWIPFGRFGRLQIRRKYDGHVLHDADVRFQLGGAFFWVMLCFCGLPGRLATLSHHPSFVPLPGASSPHLDMHGFASGQQ